MSETQDADSIDFDERFAETREELDLDDGGDDRGNQRTEQSTTPDGDEVDWVALWDEFNFGDDSCVSKTQLAAAIWASDETGDAGQTAVDKLTREALDAGQLSQVKAKTPSKTELALVGFKLEDDR